MIDLQKAETIVSDDWNAVSKFVRDHPKTATFIAIAALIFAGYIGHLI